MKFEPFIECVRWKTCFEAVKQFYDVELFLDSLYLLLDMNFYIIYTCEICEFHRECDINPLVQYYMFMWSFCKSFVLDYYPKRSFFLLFCLFISDWQGTYLSGCSHASPLLGFLPAAWVYAAAAMTLPDAAPLKEQDPVSVATSWYVGSGAVMYSPLCPAYDWKLAIPFDCCINNNAMCRELIKFGLLVCAALQGKEGVFFGELTAF
jgi:hypothetical protein